jgi:hypothetical protein
MRVSGDRFARNGKLPSEWLTCHFIPDFAKKPPGRQAPAQENKRNSTLTI